MFCSSHSRILLILAAIGLGSICLGRAGAQVLNPSTQNTTRVHLRWGQRTGVSRYRLQLSRDGGFNDIVFDRVVGGTDFEVTDLEPGRYFWRVAALTGKLGDFSSAGVIEVKPASTEVPSVTENSSKPLPSLPGGGWRAALGNINDLVTAHLRAADRSDLVALNAAGSVFAIDAPSGVPLWSVRLAAENERTAARSSVLVVPGKLRLDNVVVLQGSQAVELEGSTGRELWRAALPIPAAAATRLNDRSGSLLVIIDESYRRMLMIDEATGGIKGQLTLPARLIGPPVSMNDGSGIVLAYQSGDIEIRDSSAAVVRSANVGSTVTTPPLVVRGQTADLILLGTRAGLSALNAGDLRALGRVTIPDDAPRGKLVAQDLNSDGVAEVILATERGHLIAVNATNGKIVWDAPVQDHGDSLAFADVDGDRVLDVFVSGERKSPMALSGRDGSVIWKDDDNSTLATNHATAAGARDLVAIASGSNITLIAIEPSGTGLRAITFSNAQVRSQPR
jgi:outer membrane protein assembly factor BamB